MSKEDYKYLTLMNPSEGGATESLIQRGVRASKLVLLAKNL